MIISHKHKFIFFHIPKCAGTSVYSALCNSLGVVDNKGEPTCSLEDHMLFKNPPNDRFGNSIHLNQHFCYEGVKYYLDEQGYDIDDYFKFSFVRNPWARTVSYWTYEKDARSFRDYCIEEKDIQFDRIKKPNCYELGVDYVGKSENLDQDFNYILDRLNLPRVEIKTLNKSVYKPYKAHYTSELIEIIEEKYAVDINAFGYSYEDR